MQARRCSLDCSLDGRWRVDRGGSVDRGWRVGKRVGKTRLWRSTIALTLSSAISSAIASPIALSPIALGSITLGSIVLSPIVLPAGPAIAAEPQPLRQTVPVPSPSSPMANADQRQEVPTLEVPSLEVPPLIDREILFGNPDIAAAQLSPDGQFLAFLKPRNDVLNIWVKRLDEPFSAARPLTDASDRPIFNYFWSYDGRYILYSQDQGGNENYRIYAVTPDGAAPPRDLTPLDEVRAFIYAVPRSNPNEIIIGLNDRDPRLHDVYRLNLTTGERSLLVENTENMAFWSVDDQGQVRLGMRQTADGGTELLRVDGPTTLTSIYRCGFGESCNPIRFHPDGQRVYLSDNRGDDVDLERLALLDLATGELEPVEQDPENEVDLSGTIFSRASDRLLATIYEGDRQRVYPRDPDFAQDYAALQAQLPDGDLSIDIATNDDRQWIVRLGRDVDPGTVYHYDRTTDTLTELYQSRPELDRSALAPMQPIHYTARDGLRIPAYLTLPQGVAPEQLPLVVHPHGGPWARDTWGYDPTAQFLANRGYAVLQPNFRGSTGYGKAFLNAGNGEWGTGAMQHDLTDGVRYLVEQGIVDPERVAIYGGSYGGYASLAGLTFTPEVYAAGISEVGPSNLFTLIGSIPPYWEPVRKLFTLRVGDPDNPQDHDRLRAQSPLFAADQIRAPLMVIQGANDPRVKQAESDQIVAAAHQLGLDVQYLLAPDEGHGFAGALNRLAAITAVEQFLGKHLGGRVQTEVPADVAERLRSLQVDPATVTAPSSDPSP